MSKLSSFNKIQKENKDKVINFMKGVSYKVNPLDTLKMVAASSIFGEPSYYRDSKISGNSYLKQQILFWKGYESIFPIKEMTTEKLFEKTVNEALDFDFKGVLDFAVELRHNYLMRLNPQVIMVLASIHPSRAEFNKENPGYFSKIQEQVMSRGDEPASQFSYFLYKNGGNKNHLPSILKRSWAKKLGSLSEYEINKYKNSNEGIINTVRVSHAKSDSLGKLLNNQLIVEDSKKTWNQFKSEGLNWYEILQKTRIPYMALLKNLRGIGIDFNTLNLEHKVNYKDLMDVWNNLTDRIIKEVETSKQFPFRFKVAYDQIEATSNIFGKEKALYALTQAMNLSRSNMPFLRGKTAALSDNSGSAWGTLPSEYGTVRVAEIGNLSSVITALNSEDGHVFTFGDSLKEVSLNNGDVLASAKAVDRVGLSVGMNTETGVFLFFRNAIEQKEHWDNIFIYSDMQAGARGCYDASENDDLGKLIKEYRSKVNKNVNLYSIQTAGYNNTIVPAYSPRQTLLYGWTGKELLFAHEMNNFWDNISNKQ